MSSESELRAALQNLRYDSKTLAIAREKRRIISDRDSQYVYGYGWHDAIDAIQAALASPPASEQGGEPTLTYDGSYSCARCGPDQEGPICEHWQRFLKMVCAAKELA